LRKLEYSGNLGLKSNKIILKENKIIAIKNNFTTTLGIQHPIICGPMYPCSNPELIAAVSEAGAIGIIQPISLTFVHKYDFRTGIKFIRTLTSKPLGLNALIEKSSKRYQAKMQEWINIALEEDIRFFITSLGNPKWVVDQVHPFGGIVYHDVTEKKWAEKGLSAGVDGLIAVNNRAGGHAGVKTKEALFEELRGYGVPIICAGGIGTSEELQHALALGYQGVQMGTRFIASSECTASDAYKNAIVSAKENDIVLSEKITGIPVSVIMTPYIKSIGLKANAFTKLLLRLPKTKHWVRTFYTILSLFRFKKSLFDESPKKEFWQAGKSVEGIESILPVKNIIEKLTSN
jgi:nitronate monooxygenase